jgi:hypothetical protein
MDALIVDYKISKANSFFSFIIEVSLVINMAYIILPW